MSVETINGSTVRLPGEGETISLFGDSFTIKLAGEETGGALAVIEADLAPHSGGTPLHVNTREDENYYVVEGTLTFRLGERTIEAPADLSSTSPEEWVHTHWNATAKPVRFLGSPSPAGFEKFFADFAALMAEMPPGPPDMGRISSFYEKYGLRVVGPPPNSEGGDR